MADDKERNEKDVLIGLDAVGWEDWRLLVAACLICAWGGCDGDMAGLRLVVEILGQQSNGL